MHILTHKNWKGSMLLWIKSPRDPQRLVTSPTSLQSLASCKMKSWTFLCINYMWKESYIWQFYCVHFKKDTGPSKNILSLYQSSPLPLFQLHVQCTSTQRESGDPLKPKSTLKLLGLHVLRTVNVWKWVGTVLWMLFKLCSHLCEKINQVPWLRCPDSKSWSVIIIRVLIIFFIVGLVVFIFLSHYIFKRIIG